MWLVDRMTRLGAVLSHSYGGQSVFGWEHPSKDCADANDIQAPTRSSK
jgi:hypothetical protein